MSGPSFSSAAQLIASMVQLRVGTPSTSTVHAPQDESSQPRLDPVKSNSWRRTSSSSSLGSIANSYFRPFTRSSISSFFMTESVRVYPNVRSLISLQDTSSFRALPQCRAGLGPGEPQPPSDDPGDLSQQRRTHEFHTVITHQLRVPKVVSRLAGLSEKCFHLSRRSKGQQHPARLVADVGPCMRHLSAQGRESPGFSRIFSWPISMSTSPPSIR